jgi:hypothetical protein
MRLSEARKDGCKVVLQNINGKGSVSHDETWTLLSEVFSLG